MKTYSVYIMASSSGVLYIGITNDLERRAAEHKKKLVPGFFSALQRFQARVLRTIRQCPRGHCQRETAEGLAAKAENCSDRVCQPAVERSQRPVASPHCPSFCASYRLSI